MTSERTVAGLSLAYEESGQEQAFRFDPDFHDQLDVWGTDWQQRTGAAPTRIRTYGAWIDGTGDCSSWHHAGRAFDIAGVDGPDEVLVSCRQDQWGELPGPEQTPWLRGYWGLAASLHLHFAYVLTYLYDTDHRNHIHVDNGVSGSGRSDLSTRSRVQVQAVQAICQHLWEVPCRTTGDWDGQTREATGIVLDRLGVTGSLTAGENWQTFLTASIGRGQ